MSHHELGVLWAKVVADYAHKRTGSSRDFWRKFLDEPDANAMLAEFRRRALRRAEDFELYDRMSNF